MIFIYQLRPRFQQLLSLATAVVYEAGITANQATVAALLLSKGTLITTLRRRLQTLAQKLTSKPEQEDV